MRRSGVRVSVPAPDRRTAVSHGLPVVLVVLALLVSPFYYGGSLGAWSIGVAAAALLLSLGLVRWHGVFDGTRTQRFVRLTARCYVRGGIFTTVVAEHRKKGWKPAAPVELGHIAVEGTPTRG